MAIRNVLICDRCGEECKDKHDRRQGHKLIVDANSGNSKTYDLCPDCLRDLKNWLKREEP
jgi:hypothetical protein